MSNSWVIGEERYGNELTPIFLSWLKNMGLGFDPFAYLDAGSDPNIPLYLVGTEVFDQIKGFQPAVVFAPAGSGKTALRVRLAWASRAQEGGRKVFPIVYTIPDPEEILEKRFTLQVHLKHLLKAAASELLLFIAYHPGLFCDLARSSQAHIRQILDWDLAMPVEHYLNQLRTAGSPDPLINTFDPTARSLPNPPERQDLLALLDCMPPAAIPGPAMPEVDARFENLVRVLSEDLNFEAIFPLVDGVDGYYETSTNPSQALVVIQPLLKCIPAWSDQHIYLKFFLPAELSEEARPALDILPLTLETKIANIEWSRDDLVKVIRERLKAASAGEFDSLDAISVLGLRQVEEILVSKAGSQPRQIIRLAEQLFIEHVRRSEEGKLAPQDLDATLAWFDRHSPTPKKRQRPAW